MLEFNYKDKYFQANGVKIHYIDEGLKSHPIIFLLHGVPSWSYIYRKIIPICVDAGFRVIAPDLPGFGLSDKPKDNEFYKLETITNIFIKFLDITENSKIIFYGQDWGSILGMCLSAMVPEKFNGLILSNGLLPDSSIRIPVMLRLWKLSTQISPYLPIGHIINFGSILPLSKKERKAYDFPFKTKGSKIAVRRYPKLIFSNYSRNPEKEFILKVWNELNTLNIPVMTAFSDSDPITYGGDKIIQSNIPGARNQNHVTLRGGHFLQEDSPKELADTIIKFANTIL